MVPGGSLYPFYPILRTVNLKFGLLEFRVTGSPAVPNFYNLYAPIPVVVKNADGVIFPHKVNLARSSTYEFAVIGQITNLQGGKINIFFQNKHASRTNVVDFTFFVIGKEKRGLSPPLSQTIPAGRFDLYCLEIRDCLRRCAVNQVRNTGVIRSEAKGQCVPSAEAYFRSLFANSE